MTDRHRRPPLAPAGGHGPATGDRQHEPNRPVHDPRPSAGRTTATPEAVTWSDLAWRARVERWLTAGWAEVAHLDAQVDALDRRVGQLDAEARARLTASRAGRERPWPSAWPTAGAYRSHLRTRALKTARERRATVVARDRLVSILDALSRDAASW